MALNALRESRGKLDLDLGETRELYDLVGMAYWNHRMMILIALVSVLCGIVVGRSLR